MKRKMAVTLLAVVLPCAAIAQESGKYQCSYSDMQRRIEVLAEPGTEVPCAVHYYKDTEMPGEQQILWSAQNDASYCEQKAEELVAKLEGWGWDCGRSVDTTPIGPAVDDTETVESDEEMLDDTDELTPAEVPE